MILTYNLNHVIYSAIKYWSFDYQVNYVDYV